MALELYHILPGVGSWSQHRHHQYLIDDAAISVQSETVLHEVAARLPGLWLLPGRPEYATDDGDSISAG